MVLLWIESQRTTTHWGANQRCTTPRKSRRAIIATGSVVNKIVPCERAQATAGLLQLQVPVFKES
jgi:hypothetical protein